MSRLQPGGNVCERGSMMVALTGVDLGERSAHLLNVLNFHFKSTEPLGQEVVNPSEDRKENETEYTRKDWPKKVNNADNADLFAAENDHRNADEGVEEAHQNIESSQYFARLQD
jgi:hypothetical protein